MASLKSYDSRTYRLIFAICTWKKKQSVDLALSCPAGISVFRSSVMVSMFFDTFSMFKISGSK